LFYEKNLQTQNKEKIKMKKTILVMLIITSMSFAQDDTVSPWSAYAGITSASFDDSDGRTTGLSAGVGYTINEKITVGGGLSHRGGKLEMDMDGTDIGNVDVKGNAIELWMSYSLMNTDTFSLSAGPIYAHIYEFEAEFNGMSVTESESDNDYGIYLGSSFPIKDNMGLNIGYYQGLKDEDGMKFNNLWIELGYQF